MIGFSGVHATPHPVVESVESHVTTTPKVSEETEVHSTTKTPTPKIVHTSTPMMVHHHSTTTTTAQQPSSNQGNCDGLDFGSFMMGVAITIIIVLLFKLIKSIFD